MKLKRYNSINTQLAGDSFTYTFKYINEYWSFPDKGTNGIDYWGLYNGQDNNNSIQTPSTCKYYKPLPPSTNPFGVGNNRVPYFGFSSYGALDTLIYPAGGSSVFQYGQNNYFDINADTNAVGPGIRIQSITNYSGYSPIPTSQKNYIYLSDDGTTSSGYAGNPPYYNGYTFSVYDAVNTYNYTQYKAPMNSPGAGGTDPLFYYQKVLRLFLQTVKPISRTTILIIFRGFIWT